MKRGYTEIVINNKYVSEQIEKIDNLSTRLRMLISELRSSRKTNTIGSMNNLIASLTQELIDLSKILSYGNDRTKQKGEISIDSANTAIINANNAIRYANNAIRNANNAIRYANNNTGTVSTSRPSQRPPARQDNTFLPFRPGTLVPMLNKKPETPKQLSKEGQKDLNNFLNSDQKQREQRTTETKQKQAKQEQEQAKQKFKKRCNEQNGFFPDGIRTKLLTKTNPTFIDCFNKHLATEVIKVRKNHVYGLSADRNESQHVGRIINQNCNYCDNNCNQTLEHVIPFYPASAFLGLVNGSSRNYPEIVLSAYDDTCCQCNTIKSNCMFLIPPTPGHIKWKINTDLISIYCKAVGDYENCKKNIITSLIKIINILNNIKILNNNSGDLTTIYNDIDVNTYLTNLGISFDEKDKFILTHYISGLQLMKYYTKLNKYLKSNNTPGNMNCTDQNVKNHIEKIINTQVDNSKIDQIINSFKNGNHQFGKNVKKKKNVLEELKRDLKRVSRVSSFGGQMFSTNRRNLRNRRNLPTLSISPEFRLLDEETPEETERRIQRNAILRERFAARMLNIHNTQRARNKTLNQRTYGLYFPDQKRKSKFV